MGKLIKVRKRQTQEQLDALKLVQQRRLLSQPSSEIISVRRSWRQSSSKRLVRVTKHTVPVYKELYASECAGKGTDNA